MMKILPILLQVIGVSVGVLLGLWLKSGSDGAAASGEDTHQEADAHGESDDGNSKADAKDDGHGDKKKKEKKKKKKKKKNSGHGEDESEDDAGDSNSDASFMKFSRQFIVPVIRTNNVNALVVIDINIELLANATEKAYTREPKIRDALLSALLRLSNEGAFGDQLLNQQNIEHIREQLLTAAQSILGDSATDILILSIARQDF